MSTPTRPVCSTPDTWADFATLVEANGGVWGGCWCMGFHPEGVGKGHTPDQNREAKHAHVRAGTVHQVLVYDGDACVGWCQYGPPAEIASIKNPKAYEAGLDRAAGLADRLHLHRPAPPRQGRRPGRRGGGAHAIEEAGGGLVEAYPEQVEGRPPQRGAFLHTGPEDLFEEFGFERDRRIAKWRWVMRRQVPA